MVVTSKEEDFTNQNAEVHHELELSVSGLVKGLYKTREYFKEVDVVHVPVNIKQLMFVRLIYNGSLVAGPGIQHELYSRTLAKRLNIDKMVETHEYISYLWRKSGVDSTYIYPTIDEDIFYPFGREELREAREEVGVSEKDTVLLFVGKLNKFKGAHLFYQLVKEHYSGGDITPVVAGNGPLREKFEEDGDFLYAGFVDNENLPIYYNIADITIVPSKHESFSIVSLESIACGTPVITTTSDSCDMSRIFQDTGAYTWTEERSPESINSEIDNLTSNKSKYRQKVKKGFKTIQNKELTISHVIKNYIDIYKEVSE
ncbi:glycosyltransferase family 4 protein [Halorutilales archaeon Cl-col2-1]